MCTHSRCGPPRRALLLVGLLVNTQSVLILNSDGGYEEAASAVLPRLWFNRNFMNKRGPQIPERGAIVLDSTADGYHGSHDNQAACSACYLPLPQ